MNYSVDDYSMGHILRFARETGVSALTIDFVKGEGYPPVLLRDPISDLPRWYTKMFWDLVARSGSDCSMVQKATLELQYDLERTRPGPLESLQSPYHCEVSITDVRGKIYSAHFAGWWYVERGILIRATRKWWNPLNWFRHSRSDI